MDPISRESSPSYLPIAGLICGLAGLLIGVIALVNASKANKAAAATQVTLTEQTARIDGFESSISSASAAADSAARNFGVLKGSTQDGFNLISTELGKINGEIVKLQEAATKSASAPKGAAKSVGPVVAGPDEYVIKAGDTFSKIARALGTTLADIQAVNPGVDSGKLKVGQKIKLPKK